MPVSFSADKYMPDFNPNKSRYNLFIDVFLFLVGCITVGSFIIMELLLLYDPCGITFLGSLVPPQHFNFITRMGVIVYHTYLLIVAHFAVCSIVMAVIVYGYYITPFYLRELRMSRPKYTTENRLRTIPNIQIMFRGLQILHSHAMKVLGLLLLMVNGYAMFTTMFCNAVLILYSSRLSLMSRVQLTMMCFSMLLYWLFVLELGRYFFAKGSKTIGSWKGNKWGNDNKQMKKFQRSCKPILICCGSEFVIRRATVLVFLRGVVRGTFRSLLLIGKK